MKIHDVTMTIHHGMPVYRNHPEKRPVLVKAKTMPRDSINESAISMNLHTGTHFDSPRHMMEDGWQTESLPLDKLLTPCRVLDLTQVKDGITREDLLPFDIQPGEFILLKTRNSYETEFRPDFIYLRKDGAEYLADAGIKGVGIDALGVERGQPGHETHLMLFQKDVLILEGLALRDVADGSYFLVALPLKIRDAEGAPARVLLLDDLSVLN